MADVDILILGSGKEGVKDEVSLQFNEYVVRSILEGYESERILYH